MQALITATLEGANPHLTACMPLVRRLLRHNPEFNLQRVGSPQRGAVERYIADVFATTYGAEVSSFAPFLLSMQCAGRLSAAAGIRPATSGPLFVEQYLDEPVEQMLAQRYGVAINRDEVFELSNLAALRPGVSQLIYLIMAGMLSSTPLNYAVFAGTRQVAKGVAKMGFEMECFGAADPARLGAAAANWGSYYASAPQVMAINLRESMKVLEAMPLPSVMFSLFEPTIAELADHFNSVHR